MVFIIKKTMKSLAIWTPTNEERDSILSLHNKPYDGFATLQGQNNLTPLTVQDHRLDQQGMTLSNTGKIKGFSNVGINESTHKNMCEQCGSVNEQMYGQDLYDSEDLDPDAGFDYIEGPSNDVDTFEGMHKNLYKEQYDEVDPEYDFMSGGPVDFEDDNDPNKGLEDEYEQQQDELDYESQHDWDPEARQMIANLDHQMDDEYSGEEEYDGEKSAYNFVSGGPFDGGTFANESIEAKKEQKIILEMFQRMSKF
jgi:hypothetical protein